jgi:DNA modification methylase
VTVTILKGDCRDVLRTLPDESVHCVVTSPPYWGLRDYGVAGQLGLEAGYAEYVDGMVEVFREVRRVLEASGTVWLNLGDCYATGAGKVGEHPGGGAQGARWRGDGSKHDYGIGPMSQPNGMPQVGLKAKDLVGIPWRVAFALQADGWYLRQDIIWSKPNPMPESVRDRCTKAHEYLFLLSKSERYYYDADAIKEASATEPHAPGNSDKRFDKDGTHSWGPERMDKVWGADGKRNRRSVWEVTTQPFSEAHFATFPPALIEPCILAGCPAGGTVLDPFGGAGTTGMVADRLGRNAILIELNPEYAAMAERRIRGDAGMFADVSSP